MSVKEAETTDVTVRDGSAPIDAKEIWSVKWFVDIRCLCPEFTRIKASYTITRTQLLLNGDVRTKLRIE